MVPSIYLVLVNLFLMQRASKVRVSNSCSQREKCVNGEALKPPKNFIVHALNCCSLFYYSSPLLIARRCSLISSRLKKLTGKIEHTGRRVKQAQDKQSFMVWLRLSRLLLAAGETQKFPVVHREREREKCVEEERFSRFREHIFYALGRFGSRSGD